MTVQAERDRHGGVRDLVVQEGLFPDTGPKLTERGQELLALHEAAHAVLLHLDGGDVLSVALDAEVYAGGARGRRWTTASVLAGVAVERVEGSPLPHPAAMSKSGLRVAGWGADLQSYRRLYGHVRRLRGDLAETEARVREHMPVIRRVAAALLERGRLDGDEVRALAGEP